MIYKSSVEMETVASKQEQLEYKPRYFKVQKSE